MEIRRLRLSGAPVVAAGVIALAMALAAPAAAQSVIKIGSPTIKESVHHWMLEFEKRIEKRAGDRIDVKVFPLSQLGTIPRMVEGAQLGTIELVMVPPAFLVGLDQRFQVLAAPGIFKDQAHGFRTAHDPEFKKAFWALGEPKGIKMVGIFCAADTNYASRTPIRTLADFRGKKIRVFASAMERESMRRLGATAAPTPLSEVLPALQRGVLDGAKSGIVIFVAFKFQHVAKYVTRTNESLICVPTLASKVWFGKLSSADQRMILEEARLNDIEMQPRSEKFNANIYKVWKKIGGELINLSPADKAEFDKRLSSVGDAVMRDKPEVRAMYELMKQAALRQRDK
jgi:TRAP-type C4-dicarboxylate transport system substrate-binding protein